ncbi:MAG: hypothetical protein AB7G12_07335 [Thermoanaerobaculia bacterium]
MLQEAIGPSRLNRQLASSGRNHASRRVRRIHSGFQRIRLFAVPTVLALALAGCGRIYRGTEEVVVSGGTIAIENWEDPVDQLRSRRIYWLPEGATVAEPVGETFAEGAPTLVREEGSDVTLAICLGGAARYERSSCCFSRSRDSAWSRSRESECDSSPLPRRARLRRAQRPAVEPRNSPSVPRTGSDRSPHAPPESSTDDPLPVFRSAVEQFELCRERATGTECWKVAPEDLAEGEQCGTPELPWLVAIDAAGEFRCRFASEPDLIAWLPVEGLAIVSIAGVPAQNYDHHVFVADTGSRQARHLFDAFGSALIRPSFAPGGQLLAYGVAQRGAPCTNRQEVAVVDVASGRSIPLQLPTSELGADEVVIHSHSIVGWRSETVLEVRSEAWRCREGEVENLDESTRLLSVPTM